MESAFGVDHGISKSFSGGVYKPISQMSAKQRQAIRAPKKGPTKADTKAKKELTANESLRQKMVSAHGESHKVRSPTSTNPWVAVSPAPATVIAGGKSSRKSSICGAYPRGSEKFHRGIDAHEAAHAKPKRSAYRLHHTIKNNPAKSMREESRADYLGFGHYRAKGTEHFSAYSAAAKQQAKGKERAAKAKGKGLLAEKAAKYRNKADQKVAYAPFQGTHYKPTKKAFNAYSEVQDSMKRAGTKTHAPPVRKS